MTQTIQPKSTGRRKTHLVLADQAMVSGINFAVGILLARFLGPYGYGQYVLANGVILFVAGIQMAFVIAPMMSTGPTLRSNEADGYYRAVTFQQLWFCGLMTILLIGGSYVAVYFKLVMQFHDILWPMTAAMAGFICQDYLRRYYFTRDHSVAAFTNDAISYGLRILLVVTAGLFLGLTATLALWLTAATSLFAFGTGILFRRPRAADRAVAHTGVVQTASQHWAYGKWLLAANVAYWIGSQLVIYLSAAMFTVASAGAIVAALNIVAVANILFLSLENFVPSRAARMYSSRGISGLNRYLRRVAILGGTCTLVIVAIGAAGAELWLSVFYGSAYQDYGWIVHWWGLYYIVGFFQRPISAGLRAMGETRAIFMSNLGGAATVILLSYVLMRLDGLRGAMVSLCLSQFVMVAIMALLYRRAYTRVSGQGQQQVATLMQDEIDVRHLP